MKNLIVSNQAINQLIEDEQVEEIWINAPGTGKLGLKIVL